MMTAMLSRPILFLKTQAATFESFTPQFAFWHIWSNVLTLHFVKLSQLYLYLHLLLSLDALLTVTLRICYCLPCMRQQLDDGE